MKSNTFLSLVISFLFFLVPPFLVAQSNISGIINTYYEVTAYSQANNAMTVTNITGLASGDEVLVIQMQGAAISQTNNSSYGSVSNYQGAGRYELARVCEINGNEVIFDSTLVYSGDYAANGNIQLVSIPAYGNAIITGTLTAAPWDGSTGGVLILRVAGSLTLNADIELDGLGFRAGVRQNVGNNCNAFFPPNNYAYTNALDGAAKGEGIIALTALAATFGKGAPANGGGGGNNHNAGGGGGGNGGAGGQGGENETTGTFRCRGPQPGVGGRSVNQAGRIFLGGGGGAGHVNNNLGTSGANGGGIAFVIAGSLQAGTNQRISTRGEDAPDGFSDGSGGGGAGGSIQLLVGNYVGNIELDVSGGDGGSVNNEGLNFCMGPGGGGGGGRILAAGNLPANVTDLRTGGVSGISTAIGSNCGAANSQQGAADGSLGSLSTSVNFATATTDFLCEPLPISWGDVWAEPEREHVYIHALVLFESYEDGYEVQRSKDGAYFSPLSLTRQTIETADILHHQWVDRQPVGGVSYYRIKYTDAQGSISYSATLEVSMPYVMMMKAFPNPISRQEMLHLHGSIPRSGSIQIALFALTGQQLRQWKVVVDDQLQFDQLIDISELVPSAYLLRMGFGGQVINQKLVICP